ncbi:MAG: PQQ-dependent dehydrogenase, methanol/ethanol family [Pseudomonadales bacterium]|nr:PQQ-dependent dehydrogenase, methanol/ethanol family [Pseudomonadales bacterium]
MGRIKVIGAYTVLIIALGGCGPRGEPPQSMPPPRAGDVTDERIINQALAEPGSWFSYGQNYKEQRFSSLTQINKDSIDRLGLAWSLPIGGPSERMQGTPLVVDGIMYVTNGWSVVYALDATTGQELWRYDPKTDREYVKYSCCGGVVNRGVAVSEGRVYVATYDGRLVSIDASTGEGLWDVDTWHPSALGRFNISGAPRVAAGKVFIGQGSSESGHRRGYVTAYDAITGDVDWRFYLVPGDPSKPFEHPEMEMAAKTWGGEWWKYGGGGTAWNSLVYDEELNTLYIGVGNGAPWPRQIRSPGGGDDLFLTAIVAVDVETGRMKWYYQTVPGDNWDYSSAMDITLGELEVDGELTKVLLQAPKNGFFYVLDRTNGDLLRAHPYTDGITWATHVDMETGRPVENPDVVFEKNPAWILPANAGAHNWEPQSWDEDQGVMYFYYHDYPNFYALDEQFVKTGKYEINEVGLSLGIAYGPYREELAKTANERPPSEGYLTAFDPLTGQHKWRHKLESVFNGGVLGTKGDLLFQGEGTGIFTARDTNDGKVLWTFDAFGSFSSSVMTYMVDGVQYVATMVSGNRTYDRPGELLVFSLDGQASWREPNKRDFTIPTQPPQNATAAQLDEGNKLYHELCAICHRSLGVPSIVASAAPDLRMMSTETQAAFEAIVLGGMKKPLGMPGFADALDRESTATIQAFVSTKAHEAREAQLARRAAEAADAAREETAPQG